MSCFTAIPAENRRLPALYRQPAVGTTYHAAFGLGPSPGTLPSAAAPVSVQGTADLCPLAVIYTETSVLLFVLSFW